MCTFLFQVIDLKGGNGDDSKAYLPIMAHVSLSVLFFSNATSAFPPLPAAAANFRPPSGYEVIFIR